MAKMAAFRLWRTALNSAHRLLVYRYILNSPICHPRFSTSTIQPIHYKDVPLKYTNSSAAKLKVEETLNLPTTSKGSQLKKFVFLTSLSVFLIYFLVLREENDFDEMLSGEHPKTKDYNDLLQLQLKLIYCKNNNLPTEKISSKISELKKKLEFSDLE